MGLDQAAREVWSRLGCDEFHRSGSIQLAKGVAVRRRVARVGQKVSKLPQGSVSSHAIEQLTINGLSRNGSGHRWHGKTFKPRHNNISPQSLHQQSPQPMDISAVMTGSKCQSCGSQTRQRQDCWYKDETCKIRGKRTLGKMIPKRKCTNAEKRKL